MKGQIVGMALVTLLITSCASIPKETVTLSKTIGSDLQVLHSSHYKMVQMYFGKIETDVNTFIEDVYAPYIIHHVLQTELDKYKSGKSSLYGIIETAGKTGGKSETEEALNVMVEFQEAANSQITDKKNELLEPILIQEREVLDAINLSYQNTIYANASLTAYLTSLHKVKESQSEALSVIGLEGLDVSVSDKLIELSVLVDKALEKGEKIDIKSDDAYEQIEDIVGKFKELTNKK